MSSSGGAIGSHGGLSSVRRFLAAKCKMCRTTPRVRLAVVELTLFNVKPVLSERNEFRRVVVDRDQLQFPKLRLDQSDVVGIGVTASPSRF